MARPRKYNADYFSHDNNMRNHRKIKAIINKFGLVGYAIYNMLLETLTEADNFRIELSKSLDWELLASDFGIEVELLKNIINYLVELELLIKENNSYWCENLIDRLSPLLDKRELFRQKYINKIVSTAEIKVSTAEMPQSKVNKSKVNNNINNNIAEASSAKSFDFNNKKELMKKGSDIRMKIILLYWSFKGIEFNNKEQYESAIRRELKASNLLKGYGSEKIKETMIYLDKQDFKWTLETVHKYIDENINKLNNKQYARRN